MYCHHHHETFATKSINQPSPVSLPGGYLLLLNLHHLVLLFKGNIIVTLHSKYVVQFVAMAYTLNLASQQRFQESFLKKLLTTHVHQFSSTHRGTLQFNIQRYTHHIQFCIPNSALYVPQCTQSHECYSVEHTHFSPKLEILFEWERNHQSGSTSLHDGEVRVYDSCFMAAN